MHFVSRNFLIPFIVSFYSSYLFILCLFLQNIWRIKFTNTFLYEDIYKSRRELNIQEFC